MGRRSARIAAPRSSRLRLGKDLFHGHRHQKRRITCRKKRPRPKRPKRAKETAAASPFDSNPDLKNTLAQIEKQFGEGAIMPLGAEHAVPDQGIPTGSLSLDLALGGQGIPHGRIVEIFGPESSGKTTLALHVVAQAQRAGGIAAFIDAEHALDPSWAKKLGVELETLLVSQPGSGEEAMHITEMLIKSNAVDVIVIDSVAALVPKKELEGEIGDSHVGLQARLMSQSMRKLTGVISKSKTAVIFINHALARNRDFFEFCEFSRLCEAGKFPVQSRRRSLFSATAHDDGRKRRPPAIDWRPDARWPRRAGHVAAISETLVRRAGSPRTVAQIAF